jgi:hypothetical protein
MSQGTADLLTVDGKGGWFFAREEKVIAKGKGQLQTYWLASEGDKDRHSSSLIKSASEVAPQKPSTTWDKSERLVKWNGDLLLGLLRDIEATRDVKSI